MSHVPDLVAVAEAAAAVQVDGHSQQQHRHPQQAQQHPQQAQQAQQAVDPSTRLYLEAATEQLIARHTAEVGRAC